MPPSPIQYGGAAVDLSPRLFKTAAVVASPAAAAETIIATITVDQDIAVMEGAVLAAYAAFTVGTNGVSVTLRIRQTDTSGTVIATTGAVTYTAANLGSLALNGVDTACAGAGQKYVLTMTVASGSAASTVAATSLSALVV